MRRRPAAYGDALTEREKGVRDLMVEGASNKEIARALNISHRTVESHRASILAKTGARNAVQLLRLTDERLQNV